MKNFKCSKGHEYISPLNNPSCPQCGLANKPKERYTTKYDQCHCGRKKTKISRECQTCYSETMKGKQKTTHFRKMGIQKEINLLKGKIGIAQADINRWERIIQQYERIINKENYNKD